jgi:hypothetical protein
MNRFFTPSVFKVLSAMEESTKTPHWAAELQQKTGLSKTATLKAVATIIKSAGVANTWEEDLDFSAKRAPRKYCELTNSFLNMIRPQSSVSQSSV